MYHIATIHANGNVTIGVYHFQTIKLAQLIAQARNACHTNGDISIVIIPGVTS